MNDDFLNNFLSAIPHDSTILDFGAGDGLYSNFFVDHGFFVISLDILPQPMRLNKNIKWIQTDFRALRKDWLISIEANVIFCRNVLNFYDSFWIKKTLLSALNSSTSKIEVIAIQAFWDCPKPAFCYPYPSYWTTKNLIASLQSKNVIFDRQFWEESSDEYGVKRNFAISQVILN